MEFRKEHKIVLVYELTFDNKKYADTHPYHQDILFYLNHSKWVNNPTVQHIKENSTNSKFRMKRDQTGEWHVFSRPVVKNGSDPDCGPVAANKMLLILSQYYDVPETQKWKASFSKQLRFIMVKRFADHYLLFEDIKVNLKDDEKAKFDLTQALCSRDLQSLLADVKCPVCKDGFCCYQRCALECCQSRFHLDCFRFHLGGIKMNRKANEEIYCQFCSQKMGRMHYLNEKCVTVEHYKI